MIIWKDRYKKKKPWPWNKSSLYHHGCGHTENFKFVSVIYCIGVSHLNHIHWQGRSHYSHESWEKSWQIQNIIGSCVVDIKSVLFTSCSWYISNKSTRFKKRKRYHLPSLRNDAASFSCGWSRACLCQVTDTEEKHSCLTHKQHKLPETQGAGGWFCSVTAFIF